MSEDNWKLLDKAILLAVEKHHGQIDKSGRPYILHPLRVMQSFKDPLYKIIAVLHDVAEDCDVTIEEIKEQFGHIVALHVGILTKKKGQSLNEYLAAFDGTIAAKAVKIKDIEDNMSPFRLAKLPRDTAERMVGKYIYCLSVLCPPN